MSNLLPSLVTVFLISGLVYVTTEGLIRMRAEAAQILFFLKLGTVLTLALPLLIFWAQRSGFHGSVSLLPLRTAGRLTQLAAVGDNEVGGFDWLSRFGAPAYGVVFMLLIIRLMGEYVRTAYRLRSSRRARVAGISVYLKDGLSGPLTFGVLAPKIYLPAEFVKMRSVREVELALHHERQHLRKHDPLWRVASMVAEAILFFSPFARLLQRRMELFTEIVCDEMTCKFAGASPQEYGELLLQLVCQRSQKFALTLDNSNLKQRITAMTTKNVRRPLLNSFATVALLTLAFFAVAASAGSARDKSVYRISAEVFMNGRLISNPRIVTLDGETASIEQIDPQSNKRLMLLLRATSASTPSTPNAVLIRADMQFSDGASHLESQPQIVMNTDSSASIASETAGGGKIEIKLSLAKGFAPRQDCSKFEKVPTQGCFSSEDPGRD